MDRTPISRRRLLGTLGLGGLIAGLGGCSGTPLAGGRPRRSLAAHRIGPACNGCGACPSACPVKAIRRQGDRYRIDRTICIDCGSCVDECPTMAITAG